MTTMPFIESPISKDFEVIVGDTFYFDFRLLDAAGTPLDLTNWDGWLEGKLNEADAEPTVSLRVGSGFTLGGVTGRITCKAAPEVTSDWPVNTVTYRLKLKDEAGDVQTFFTGTIGVLAEN